jgi:undecaprenyl-diphosphatase
MATKVYEKKSNVFLAASQVAGAAGAALLAPFAADRVVCRRLLIATILCCIAGVVLFALAASPIAPAFAALDLAAFHALNAVAGRSVAVDAVFIYGAKYLILLLAALLVHYVAVSWKTIQFEKRIENVSCAILAAVFGFLGERLIGFLWFRPRPFVMLDDVLKLIEKSPLERSFPSGHATVAFALAFVILLRDRKRGWPLFCLASFIGLSRVVVGVHYPSDILAGALLGFLVALAAAPAKKTSIASQTV